VPLLSLFKLFKFLEATTSLTQGATRSSIACQYRKRFIDGAFVAAASQGANCDA
jgi:hypothetical protein